MITSREYLNTTKSILRILATVAVVLATADGSIGRVKLGQPVPDSNLSVELKSGSPVTTST